MRSAGMEPPLRSDYTITQCSSRVRENVRLSYPEFPSVKEVVSKFNGDRGRANKPKRPTPYSVQDIRGFACKLDPEFDLVCLFVGLTSVGKTCILKALFDLDPDDELLAIGPQMDVTKGPYVILWKIVTENNTDTRTWLMDFPGVHGSQFHEGMGDMTRQLVEMRHVAQACCFVVSGNLTDEMTRLFTEVVTVLQDRVFIAYNSHKLVRRPEDWNKLGKESHKVYNDVLSKEVSPDANALSIVLLRVARCPGATKTDLDDEKGIELLEEQLLRWLRVRRHDIGVAARWAREKEIEAQIEKKATALTHFTAKVTGGLALALPTAMGVADFVTFGLAIPLGPQVAGFVVITGLGSAAAFGVTGATSFATRYVLRKMWTSKA